MKNFNKVSSVITLPAPYDVASGAGLLVGLIFGVATHAALSGGDVETKLTGEVTLPAVTANTFAVGAAVYWDNTAKNCTSTVGSNTKIGVATLAKINGDTTVRVRLNGTF